MAEESSVIQDLIRTPFLKCPLTTKKEIFLRGRPTPKLHLYQKVKHCVLSFNPSIYRKFEWLSGCAVSNLLFCWTCLLFQSPHESKNVWNNVGFGDLGHIHTSASRHSKSKIHGQATIAAQTFRAKIENNTAEDDEIEDEEQDLDDGSSAKPMTAKQRAKIVEHNRKVDRNRKILHRLIDMVCYLTKLDCPLRGKKEYGDSDNKGNYIEMLNLASKYDQFLRDYFDSKPIFVGKSNRIQNDLVSSVVGCMTKKIQTELDETGFVAIGVDSCKPDILDDQQTRMSIVFKYVTDSKPIDRFLSFVDIPRGMNSDQKVDTISSMVIETVVKWKCETKLVCQSYDSDLISTEELCRIEHLVCDRFSAGLLVDSQSRIPNQLISRSLCSIRECKIFFSFTESLSRFLSSATKRNIDFGKTVGRKIGSIPPSKWNNPSRQVNNISENIDTIIAFFDEILDNFAMWADEDVNAARGFHEYFFTFECRFLLKIFGPVFELTDNLYNVMQKKSLEIGYCQQQFLRVQNSIEEMKSDQRFENLFYNTITLVGQPMLRKCHGVYVDNPFHHLKLLYYQIFDNITTQLYARFRHLEQLKYFELLDCGSFKKFAQTFPDDLVDGLAASCHGSYFDLETLKIQLRSVYSEQNSCFENQSLAEFVDYIDKNELDEIFTECRRLATLALTILPIERKHSILKGVDAYCQRNNTTSTTMGQSRLNHLSLIVIEKDLLTWLQQKDPEFYNNVINNFNRLSSRRVELIYMSFS